MSSTSFLDIRPTSDQSTSVEARELINVNRSDVGDYLIMDMTVPATDRTTATVVNSAGAIYRCSAPDGTKTLCVLELSLLRLSYDRSRVSVANSYTRSGQVIAWPQMTILGDLRHGRARIAA